MARTKPKADSRQENQIARLLLNFSGATANVILKRFDRTTRDRVRSRMDELAGKGVSPDEGLLTEFADFLYFEPAETAPDDSPEIRSVPRANRINDSQDQTENQLTIRDVIGLPDVALDLLLKTAPSELTISVLKCTPQSFVRRVLTRLSHDEAEFVREQISSFDTVDYAAMQTIHQRYCDCVKQLDDQGLI